MTEPLIPLIEYETPGNSVAHKEPTKGMPSGKKRKRQKIKTHKRKKKRRAMRHKKRK